MLVELQGEYPYCETGHRLVGGAHMACRAHQHTWPAGQQSCVILVRLGAVHVIVVQRLGTRVMLHVFSHDSQAAAAVGSCG